MGVWKVLCGKMKLMYIGIIALILVFGCITPEPVPEKEELLQELEVAPELPDEELISFGLEDAVWVVTVRTAEEEGKNHFPLEEYEDEFLGVDLYSDSFIKLDRTHIRWLSSGEAIWITPMVRDGKGVLFNAMYTNEWYCNRSEVSVLGKQYRTWIFEDGLSFENNDKWKVRIEEKEGCERLVIYMDGYFYDIEEGEEIPLFRNDGSLSLVFEDLEGRPQANIIAKGGQGRPDRPSGEIHQAEVAIDDGGIGIMFYGLPEAERAALDNWTIVWLGGQVFIGRQTFYNWSYFVESKVQDWETAGWNDVHSMGLVLERGQERVVIPQRQAVEVEGRHILNLESYSASTYGSQFAQVLVLEDMMNLTDPQNNVTFVWDKSDWVNPKLISVFIPSSSPIFGNVSEITK